MHNYLTLMINQILLKSDAKDYYRFIHENNCYIRSHLALEWTGFDCLNMVDGLRIVIYYDIYV